MNILFLDSIETGVYGGMEEWIRLAAIGLADRGHNIVAVGRSGSAFLKRLEGHADKLTLVGKNLSGDFNPIAIATLRGVIREHDIDLISVNFNRDVRLGGLAARLGGDVRVVWSVGLNITGAGLAHRHLTPRLIDGVLVPSQALKDQITDLGYVAIDAVKVIPIGISDPAAEINRITSREKLASEFGVTGKQLVCVTSGRLVEQKGHRHLVEAGAEIVRANPNARFLWLGDGPLKERLRMQLDDSGLSENFILAGMRDNVGEFLPGCDLMIHPSIDEPFGIALVEGMRAGLPIVASRVGGIPEVVAEDETALLVPAASPSKLAEAVGRMLADSELRAQFGKAGKERWQHSFRLETMIDAIERYFAETCRSEKING